MNDRSLRQANDALAPEAIAAWYRDLPPPPREVRERVLRRLPARGWRRVWATWSGRTMLAAAAVVLVTVAARPRAPQIPAVHVVTAPVRIELHAPTAQEVALVGDFNQWTPGSARMHRDPVRGTWATEVALPPGRHGYAFIVDGQRWTIDPRAPQADLSDFGAINVMLVAAR